MTGIINDLKLVEIIVSIPVVNVQCYLQLPIHMFLFGTSIHMMLF